jgi:acetyl-CoA acyltransferase
MREAVIVSAVRTAVGKAPKGTLRHTRPDETGAAVIKEALKRAEGVQPSDVEDVIMGCAMPEAEQGMNVARAAAIRAGLPVETSAMTINRFCSSGLQSIAIAADRIRTGSADVIVAGGLETMSMIPMGGHIIRPNPYLVEHYPDFYLNMGLATENVARKYEVTRAEQDEFALRSHERAAAAQDAGKFTDEVVPLNVTLEELDAKGKKQKREVTFDTDEGVRRDTSVESLAKLKPAFHVQGTITAGNASQMSDGAAAVVIMSAERAKELGLKPLARFVAYATAGCPPEEMGIGPVYAIPKALRIAGLSLEQIDVIELNEAFAAQSLAVIKTLGLDPDKVNVNGGAIALGHPLGCTGATAVTRW